MRILLFLLLVLLLLLLQAPHASSTKQQQQQQPTYRCSAAYRSAPAPMMIAPTADAAAGSFTVQLGARHPTRRCHVLLTRPATSSAASSASSAADATATGYYVIKLASSLRWAHTTVTLRDSFIASAALVAVVTGANQTAYRSFATAGDTAYIELRLGPIGDSDDVLVQVDYVTDCPPGWVAGSGGGGSLAARNLCYGVPDGNAPVATFAAALAGCGAVRASLASGFDDCRPLEGAIRRRRRRRWQRWSGGDNNGYWVGVWLDSRRPQPRLAFWEDSSEFFLGCPSVPPDSTASSSSAANTNACPNPAACRYVYYQRGAFHRACASATPSRRGYICSTRRHTGNRSPPPPQPPSDGHAINDDSAAGSGHSGLFYWAIAAVAGGSACVVATVCIRGLRAWQSSGRRRSGRRLCCLGIVSLHRLLDDPPSQRPAVQQQPQLQPQPPPPPYSLVCGTNAGRFLATWLSADAPGLLPDQQLTNSARGLLIPQPPPPPPYEEAAKYIYQGGQQQQ